jgi:hypothetical protein
MTMKVWSGEVDTVVAADLEDVRKVLIDLYGDTDDVVEMMNDGFAPVPDDQPITIENVDTFDHDGRCAPVKLTMTAAEWISREGRGLLCSTEY